MSRRLTLALSMSLSLVAACELGATDGDASTDGSLGKADDPTAIGGDFGFPNLTTLEAPPPIGFCPDIILEGDPEVGNPHTIVNRTNAHYLGYIAGNAYADFVHFAPAMEELGFGMPGEGARLTRCGADLARLRAFESRRYTSGARGRRPNVNFDPRVDDEVLEGDPEVGNPHTIVNRTNAHYLGYIAGNAYADFVHFAPEMEELGFGMPGEGARLTRCGADLARLRAFESRRYTTGARGTRPNVSFDPHVDEAVLESWGECAAEWYRGRFGVDTDAPEGVDGMFEIELTGTAHYGSRLEFFSGGEFDVATHRFEKGSTQLIWAEHRTQPLVVVAFRGTEFQDGTQDLWADLNAGKDPFHGWGEVHQGFLNALNSVMPLLDDKLGEIEGTDVRIWVTGHSLGAALATLFTAEMLHRFEQGSSNARLVGSYTFGSPRVGDEDFRVRFEELAIANDVSVWRFRNDRDVVTRVPLSFNFDHVGGLGHFEDGSIELQSMLDDSVPRGIISDLWEHHFMGAYYEHLNTWNDSLDPTAPGGLRTMRLGVDAVYNCIPTPATTP